MALSHETGSSPKSEVAPTENAGSERKLKEPQPGPVITASSMPAANTEDPTQEVKLAIGAERLSFAQPTDAEKVAGELQAALNAPSPTATHKHLRDQSEKEKAEPGNGHTASPWDASDAVVAVSTAAVQNAYATAQLLCTAQQSGASQSVTVSSAASKGIFPVEQQLSSTQSGVGGHLLREAQAVQSMSRGVPGPSSSTAGSSPGEAQPDVAFEVQREGSSADLVSPAPNDVEQQPVQGTQEGSKLPASAPATQFRTAGAETGTNLKLAESGFAKARDSRKSPSDEKPRSSVAGGNTPAARNTHKTSVEDDGNAQPPAAMQASSTHSGGPISATTIGGSMVGNSSHGKEGALSTAAFGRATESTAPVITDAQTSKAHGGTSPQVEIGIQDPSLGEVRVQAIVDRSGVMHIDVASRSQGADAVLEQIAPLMHAAVLQQAEVRGWAHSIHVTAAASVEDGGKGGSGSLTGSGMGGVAQGGSFSSSLSHDGPSQQQQRRPHTPAYLPTASQADEGATAVAATLPSTPYFAQQKVQSGLSVRI